jgi:hypothetical protein
MWGQWCLLNMPQNLIMLPPNVRLPIPVIPAT